MRVGELAVRDLITLRRDDPLEALMEALDSDQDIFPVLDERDRVIGTVGEQDLIRVIGPSRRTFPFGPRALVREGLATDVEDVMTPRPATAHPDEDLLAALKRMEALHLPQLVVVRDRHELVGLLPGRDVFRALHESRS